MAIGQAVIVGELVDEIMNPFANAPTLHVQAGYPTMNAHKYSVILPTYNERKEPSHHRLALGKNVQRVQFRLGGRRCR